MMNEGQERSERREGEILLSVFFCLIGLWNGITAR
jgi:hypothetical protein